VQSPSVPQGSCDGAEELQCDVEALSSFKNSVTRGDNLLSTWTGNNPCRWRYVTCTKIDGENLRVVELDMDFEGEREEFTLSGVMVPEFSKLRYVSEFKTSA